MNDTKKEQKNNYSDKLVNDSRSKVSCLGNTLAMSIEKLRLVYHLQVFKVLGFFQRQTLVLEKELLLYYDAEASFNVDKKF